MTYFEEYRVCLTIDESNILRIWDISNYNCV